MNNEITRHPVAHPILKKYIKFFWTLTIDNINLNVSLVPQQNINIRFNISETEHHFRQNDLQKRLDEVYFMGLHNHHPSTQLLVNGKVDILGICFQPDGVYPFFKTPLSEFSNHILSATDIGLTNFPEINQRLKEASTTTTRLHILEEELLKCLKDSSKPPDNFHQIFRAVSNGQPININEFCRSNNLNPRQLERLYLKYIGLPASTYNTLRRFHRSMNQVLHTEQSKLSDVAYDYDYFDQTHFIREFKRFTGTSPKSFIKTKDSILHIGELV